jgi:hypothetical protein
MFMPAPEIWGRLFFACTKRLLAPSGRLHQAVACTKRLLAPSDAEGWYPCYKNYGLGWSIYAHGIKLVYECPGWCLLENFI